jgi:NADPH:quinone reductase-like Zn-dependent oxidoreductase
MVDSTAGICSEEVAVYADSWDLTADRWLTCFNLYRTTYNGGPEEFQNTPLNDLVKQIEAGTMKVQIGRVFHLDEIVQAHRCMEENRAGGKIVVLT